MKTQIKKPARERASYTEQYKQEALELWLFPLILLLLVLEISGWARPAS